MEQLIVMLLIVLYTLGAVFGACTFLSGQNDSIFALYEQCFVARSLIVPHCLRNSTTVYESCLIGFVIAFCCFNPFLIGLWSATRIALRYREVISFIR